MRSLRYFPLRPHAEQVTDSVAELRAVQGVEMEVADAAGIELTAQLRRYCGGDQLSGGGQIVQSLEQIVEPLRNGRSAALGEAARRRDVRNGKDAGDDLDLDAGRCGFVAEAEEAVGREKELGDRPVRAGVDLSLEILEIEPARGRVGVHFRISRH